MAELHPQIVHFTIVLVIIGVTFRLVSLLGRPAFAGPAAATLLILAAASSVVSVRSGTGRPWSGGARSRSTSRCDGARGMG